MTDITWTNVTVTLGQLQPWERNPKSISKTHAKRLLASWDKFGQFQTVAIGPGFEVYDGHQRLSVLRAAYGDGYQVAARQSSRELTDSERRELVIAAHVGTTGQFNWDELANWDAAELQEWGLDGETLQDWRTGINAVTEMIGSESEEDDTYTRNIEAPIYEPKGDKPAISDLFDDKKANELIAEIDATDLPEEEKAFLRIAARRHTVINYKRVAEYYAHSDKPVQVLMENSALVIIDFKRAIELGYVKLSEEIAKQYLEDYPDA